MADATRCQRSKQHQYRTEKSCRTPNRRCRLHTYQIIRRKASGANQCRPATILEGRKRLLDALVPSLNFFYGLPWVSALAQPNKLCVPKPISFCPLQNILFAQPRQDEARRNSFIFSAVSSSPQRDSCVSGRLTKGMVVDTRPRIFSKT